MMIIPGSLERQASAVVYLPRQAVSCALQDTARVVIRVHGWADWVSAVGGGLIYEHAMLSFR